MPALPQMESRPPAKTGRIRKLREDVAFVLRNFRVAEKISGIALLLVVVMALLVVMSIQSVRLQAQYRQALATSATAAVNIGRVNALIYAIVMESRGIYMSPDQAGAKRYADELLRRNSELADVVTEWAKTADLSDEQQFPAFRQRVDQFVDFRNELVRRALRIGPAAARAWGDVDANRALRRQLNADLEAFAKVYQERAVLVAQLADETRLAAWYIASLGLSGLLLTALNVFVVRRSVLAPLSHIAKATDSITAGKIDFDIPHVEQWDEIGHLARAVRNFRDATCRNLEHEQLELGIARQRDAALGERDKEHDKYLETKWQLRTALNNMAQGLAMVDAKGKVLITNRRFRTMYQLPQEIIGPDTTLRDILAYSAEKGMFVGDIDAFLASILERIAKGVPSVTEFTMADGRLFRISEQPMAGGGWVSTHEDFTRQRRSERILERTERFLVTVLENVPQAILAKDARTQRYTFVNKAAEKLLGLPRVRIIGMTVRDLFPAQTSDLIESKDRELMAGNSEGELLIRTVETPNNGQRTVAVRRLRIAGEAGESHIFLSIIEDRTDQADIADVAA